MSPADIAALRLRLSSVFRTLGATLAELEDAEAMLTSPHVLGDLRPALARNHIDLATTDLERAASQLADLIAAADQLTATLAPKGQP